MLAGHGAADLSGWGSCVRLEGNGGTTGIYSAKVPEHSGAVLSIFRILTLLIVL